MEQFLKWIKDIAYMMCVFLSIKTGVIKILIVLMCIDSIFGIIKSLRLGNKFSFKILAWGMVAKLSILVLPLIVALLGKGIEMDFTQIVIIVLNVIIVNETISIITNILSIKLKKRIENTDYVTMLIESLKNKFTSFIEVYLKSLNNNKNERKENNK